MGLSAKEKNILQSICVGSENDPNKPEFPPDNPKFPATPTYRIKVPGFKNVWLKDESHNPTGTHKDRMAWEMIVTYRDILLAKERGLVKEKLPQLSIITSGAAGVAIQTFLNKYNLPPLKCLVDLSLKKEIVEQLESLGCELYFLDLSRKALSWKEILEYTDNSDGIDVTSSEGLDPNIRYYDWFSYECINQSPDYCFIPFGSGHIYQNIVNISKKEVSSAQHDPRFKGKVETLRNCNFMGATVNDPNSIADKLYAPHRPFSVFEDQWIRCYRLLGDCGQDSNVFLVREKFIEQAMKLSAEQNIVCEPSGIAGLALLLQMKDKIPNNKKILIVNTGKVKNPSRK
ncbi:MAG: PLP-dependent lyase/thiolase [Nanoarchaeota archaeon]|nr:PLP-dependent lyase/thiolase [Nanoarchaeota archaeon]MBU1321628.1 PLP-dependent lyase/thiolase [Nanoarchaeota archaeon]MBU1597412.1 PLP-dependent lyase/thiolase [Nanoarchaeota archaeon]MBU2440925.1 PLP-dependent lyase/thiolase [Nanoarchaeota archaeon]